MGLIISRKDQESISIGGNVVVQVVKIGRSRVGLRVTAPPEMKIMRHEINQQVQSNAMVPMNAPSNGGCFTPGRIEG
jgi:carbon storage regulator CsrA